MKKVLISAPYFQPVVQRFKPTFDSNGIELVVPEVNERLEESELLNLIVDIDGVICGDDRFTEKVLRKANKLKVISKWGTGIDSIDKQTCNDLGIKVCNTLNAFTEPVADSVMGYILSFARNIPWADREMKKIIWHKIPGTSLNECTLGIIGTGNVGKAVARRAKPFGIKLLGSDLKKMPEQFISETGIKMVSIENLLTESDFISINCDLNKSSFHLISEHEFSIIKTDAVIVNTARGPIIDETALINALNSHQIGGAALDVFESEPISADNPMLKMDNVLLSPHNTNSSPKAWERVHINTINNLLGGLNITKNE